VFSAVGKKFSQITAKEIEMKAEIQDIPYSQFKDDRGRWFTAALFWEYRREDAVKPIWTTAEKHRVIDGVEYKSIKQLYLEQANPNEYLFVTETLGTSWKHWKRLTNNNLLTPIFEEAREELELLLQARGTEVTINLALEGDRNAAKTLMEKGFLEKGSKPKMEKVKNVKDEFQNNVTQFLQKVK
jgi:hypothetical protein